MTVIVYHDTPKRGCYGEVVRSVDALEAKLKSFARRHVEAVVRIMETGEEVGSAEEMQDGNVMKWNWWFDPSVFKQEAQPCS